VRTSSRWDDDAARAVAEHRRTMPTNPMTPLTANPPRQPEPQLTAGRIWGWFFFLSSCFWPRVVILTFWIFGSTIGDAFSSWVVPFLGFFLAPWTTMVYALLDAPGAESVIGWEWFFVGLAVVTDLVTWAGGRSLFKG
jgi:hypothetical protein